MSEMVERVARAIMLNDCCGCTLDDGERVFCNDARLPPDVKRGEPPCECQSNARAAIEAMREPTEAMKQVGGNFIDNDCEGIAGSIFEAMIDAALQDGASPS